MEIFKLIHIKYFSISNQCFKAFLLVVSYLGTSSLVGRILSKDAKLHWLPIYPGESVFFWTKILTGQFVQLYYGLFGRMGVLTNFV